MITNRDCYSGDICFDEGKEDPVLRRLKIKCPVCSRRYAALLSKFTKFLYLGSTVSEEEPHLIYSTKCNKCKTEFSFGVDWS